MSEEIEEKPLPQISRRKFLKVLTLSSLGLLFSPSTVSSSTELQKETLQIHQPIFWGDRSQPKVALTFDDGYNEESIVTAIYVLKEYGITATFFVIGKQLDAFPKLWQQAVDDGHEICNHTYSHSWLTSLSPKEILDEIFLWEKAAKKVLGEEYVNKMRQNFPYIRFPGGSGHNNQEVLRVVTEAGLWPIAWSIETYAAVLKNHELPKEPVELIAEKVSRHVIEFSQNGTIVLLHFNPWDTYNLEKIICELKKKKLEPTRISDVLSKEILSKHQTNPQNRPRNLGNKMTPL